MLLALFYRILRIVTLICLTKEHVHVWKSVVARELRKLWQVKVKVVSVVVGALNTTPKTLEKHLKELE